MIMDYENLIQEIYALKKILRSVVSNEEWIYVNTKLNTILKLIELQINEVNNAN